MTAPHSKNGFYAAVAGTASVALCCFTTILIVIFGTVGWSVFTPYLDYVLWPALAVFLLVTLLAYRKWKRHS